MFFVFFLLEDFNKRLWKALLLTLPLRGSLYDIHCICTAQREHCYSCVAPSFPSLSVPCIDLLLVVPYSSIHTVIYVCSCWSPFLIMGLSARYGQCFNATLQRKKKKKVIFRRHILTQHFYHSSWLRGWQVLRCLSYREDYTVKRLHHCVKFCF